MFILLIVARVTSGTIRLKCRKLPGNNFRIGLMTVCTSKIAAMVQRLKRQCHVAEIAWCPGIGVVAIVAFHRGNKVSRVFSCRRDAVMATRARTQHLCVIDIRNR